MNPSFRTSSHRFIVALFCALTLGLVAQEPPPARPIPPPQPGTATAPVAPTAPTPDTVPAATPAPGEPTTPVEAEASATEKKGGLRRIDVPADANTENSTQTNRRPQSRRRNGGSGEFPMGDHTVSKGSSMSEAVSILGSTNVEGEVRSDAVSVFGDTRVGPDGKVGGAAVAVLGRLTIEGDVKGEAVSVLGSSTINGKVGGEAVAVLGNMHLGPKAEVAGDLVIVGGKLTKDPAAIVHGNEVNVPFLGGFATVDWLVTWIKECALKGRLLAFKSDLGWAWGIAFSFFGFYLLLALLFGRGIEKCALTLETRPGASILASVLTVLLTPVATIILAVTVIGALLVPFVAAGLFFAGLFGKAVMLAWIGRRFTKFFGNGPLSHPVFAVFIGGLLVMLLYTMWGSFLLYKLLSWLGLGVVVLTVAQSMKREKAPVPAAAGVSPDAMGPMEPPVVPIPPIDPIPPVSSVAPLSANGPTMSAGFTGSDASASPTATPEASSAGIVAGGLGAALPPPVAATAPLPPPPHSVPPRFMPRAPAISATTLPRAGFFPRLAAMLLDGVLIGMLVGFTSSLLPRFLQFNHGPGGVLLVLSLYAAIMWKHKGTTIGGIVCGLKIVRVDNRDIDWATAIVRALGCFLSLAVAGLGFIWVAFDDEKQSWHDKIAGTTVVRVPKGVSLL